MSDQIGRLLTHYEEQIKKLQSDNRKMRECLTYIDGMILNTGLPFSDKIDYVYHNIKQVLAETGERE